jgi:hypothetical protein
MEATFLTAAGLFLTGIGLLYAARQLRISRKIARGEFLLHLFELVQNYNEVHYALTEDGRWANGVSGPKTQEDWRQVDRYMGLLESLQILIEDGFLDLKTVDRQYGHRVVALVRNKAIQERSLKDRAYRWRDFTALVRGLEDQESYQSIMEREGQRRIPGPRGSGSIPPLTEDGHQCGVVE